MLLKTSLRWIGWSSPLIKKHIFKFVSILRVSLANMPSSLKLSRSCILSQICQGELHSPTHVFWAGHYEAPPSNKVSFGSAKHPLSMRTLHAEACVLYMPKHAYFTCWSICSVDAQCSLLPSIRTLDAGCLLPWQSPPKTRGLLRRIEPS